MTATRDGPEPFRCELRRAGAGVVSLAPSGELDGATVGELERALSFALAEEPAALVLDLRGLTFMDAAGLHLVLDAHEQTRRAGARFIVVQGARPVRRLFELTGVDASLSLVDRHPGEDAGTWDGGRRERPASGGGR